ncbi:BACON domain-containing protein [Alistipes dispar]|uniref:BACON domain-containing protein n=3 Tax=Alistipes TaxID=239759 RepID=UPI00294227A7|nr:BACON domain-containing protein [Alistipes dispar]
MKRIFAFLFAAAALAGCSDDNGGDGGKDIRLAPGTPKDYTIFADETSGTPSEGISFTTTGPWRATVAETRADVSGGSPSWVTVSPDHGDAAGDYTITIGLGVNATGKDRRATITIECGSTKITITVEQKGTTEEGEVPDEDDDDPAVPEPSVRKLVSRIDQTIDYWSGCEDRFDTDTYVFKYDDRDRIVEYSIEVDRDGSVSDRRVCRLDYSVADEIRIEEAYDFSDGGMPERYTVSLNDAGYVRHVELPTAISTPFVCDFGYDDAGRLIRQEWSAGYSSGWTTFDYTDGVVSGGTVCDDEGENSADGFERYFGDVKNDLLNIDPNALFMGGLLYDGTENYSDILGPLDRLALLRLAGRGSDRYVVRYDGGDESVSGEDMGSWPEPNVTVHQSSEYCEYEWDETLRYAFNDDGSIATVSQEELCTRIRYEYDIVVGDELVNPDYPEGGYKCTIANETRTPVGKGTNTYIYTFTYR